MRRAAIAGSERVGMSEFQYLRSCLATGIVGIEGTRKNKGKGQGKGKGKSKNKSKSKSKSKKQILRFAKDDN